VQAATSNIVLSPADLGLAAGIAIAAALIFACIEIPSKSKASFGACFALPSLLYWIVLSFGNIVTTLLASLVVVKFPESLSPYYYLLCAFFGVFGFEAILKNTNITMFDNNVLTIQNWIEKALNGAAGAALEKQEDMKKILEAKIFAKLCRLSDTALNTRILQKMGEGIVPKLEALAQASNANPKEYKAYQLAALYSRSESRAFLKE
jgi:hypothetical protein